MDQKQPDEERVCFGGWFQRDGVYHRGRSRTLAEHVSMELLYRTDGEDVRSPFHGHFLCRVILYAQDMILKILKKLQAEITMCVMQMMRS